MDDIISLLKLEDSNLEVEGPVRDGNKQILTLFTKPQTRFCPKCGHIMHSRGTKSRTINHPIFQQSFHLVLHLKQRRWRCTNKDCKYDEAEEYRTCGDPIFERFSKLLTKYKQPIINSFILFERMGSNGDLVVSRLSNGPMEATNRLIKDLRRNAYGFRSFKHLRNRFLYATSRDSFI